MSTNQRREHRALILAEWFRDQAHDINEPEAALMMRTAAVLEQIASRGQQARAMTNDNNFVAVQHA